MDHKNRAIVSPDAFALNVAMQRALVKAIALAGIGLYIYAGEETPLAVGGDTPNHPDTPDPLDGYPDWLVAMGLIADTGNFTGLVTAIKESPVYAAHLRSKDLPSWTALKARQEAVVAPAVAAVQAISAVFPLDAATVTVGDAAPFSLPRTEGDADADAAYAKGMTQVKAAVARSLKAVKRMPS
jgi:hypothetical protein